MRKIEVMAALEFDKGVINVKKYRYLIEIEN